MIIRFLRELILPTQKGKRPDGHTEIRSYLLFVGYIISSNDPIVPEVGGLLYDIVIFYLPMSSLSMLGSYDNQEQHIQALFVSQHANTQQMEIA
jgi:hypothetical protein